MICYKETLDHKQLNPTPGLWTGTWADPAFSPPDDGGDPQNALTGTEFIMNSNGTPGSSITVSSQYSDLRIWRDTAVANLKAGQTATLGQYTLGYEWDEDDDNGFRPAGLVDLATTGVYNSVPSLLVDYGGLRTGSATWAMTMYRATSSAGVCAGTVHWSWGLEGNHDIETTTPDPSIEQATVNIFADMGVQPTTLEKGLIATTMSTDHTPPTSSITYPSQGITLTPGVPITIAGTAVDSGGGVVAGVEVSVDGGVTWHPATGTTNWTYTWTPRTSGRVTIMSRATDDSENIEKPGPGVTINPATPVQRRLACSAAPMCPRRSMAAMPSRPSWG